MVLKEKSQQQGIIVAHYGVAVDVLYSASQKIEMVRVKRNSGHVVGDSVEVKDNVLTRKTRSSELSRMDARGGVHVVGANLDTLLIVAACEPLPPPGFIDRAIIASRAANLSPVLVLNKSDLACFKDYSATIISTYRDSVPIFTTSAESGAGIDNLLSYFGENHRGVFVGPTGVGKSSIMNSILPDINLSTGEISESKKRGRHTTTVSTLHILENGGELVDSPGFNDFGLVDTTTPELALYFPGFEKAQKEPCRFRDCKHKEEPGCQVTEKVQSGEISSERYQTYLQLLEEVEMIDSEPKYRERRSRRKKN